MHIVEQKKWTAILGRNHLSTFSCPHCRQLNVYPESLHCLQRKICFSRTWVLSPLLYGKLKVALMSYLQWVPTALQKFSSEYFPLRLSSPFFLKQKKKKKRSIIQYNTHKKACKDALQRSGMIFRILEITCIQLHGALVGSRNNNISFIWPDLILIL